MKHRQESRAIVSGGQGDPEARKEVESLLRAGASEKLQRAGTDAALKKLENAYKIASEKLLRPWPEVAGYRYAHLLLRKGPQDLKTLLQVEELFTASARYTRLRPWALLYKLAVIHRIAKHPGQEVSPDFVTKAFDRCREAVMDFVREKRSVDREEPAPPLADIDTRIQDELINSLELAVYFLEVPYAPLEGLRGADDIELGSGDWFLVGTEAAYANIRFCWEMAIEELTARGENEPEAILFCLPEEPKDPWWRGGPNSRPKTGLRDGTARLLAAELQDGRRLGRTGLERLFGEDVSADTLRKTRERFRGDLAQMSGKSSGEFQDAEPPFGLNIFGAVCRSTLHRRQR
jgi:hypothetical protein